MGLPSTVEVNMELLVDRIDCPGMRLPDKDMTYLRLYLFDVDVRTAQAPPYFPVVFQEQFQFCKKFYAMKDWTELEVMLRFQALTVELLQRQIGGYSKILAEYQGNAWDVLVACNHDPVDSPVTSEGRARLVMKPTIHMPTTIAPECHVRFLVTTIGWTPPWRPYGVAMGDTVKERRSSGRRSRTGNEGLGLPRVVWTSTESLSSKRGYRGSGGSGEQVMRGAIVSAEIDVLKVCCKNLRYRPSGRVYVQVTYLGQAAATTPKLPSFPLTFAETLVFREVLDASGDEGRFGAGAAGEHLSRARVRIELKQTGPTDHPVLGYVEVRGWQVLTPVEESMYSEVEENVQLKLLALGPFLYNDDPTVHLVTRSLIQPLRTPAPLLGDDGRQSRRSSTVKRAVRMKQTTDARPPFVVRKVPSNIFRVGGGAGGSSCVRRTRSLTRKSSSSKNSPIMASSMRIRDRPSEHHGSGRGSKKGVLFRSRSADDIALAAASASGSSSKLKTATEDKVRMHGTPPSFALSCRRQPRHDRRNCRVCCLYEEYFGESYPGHNGGNAQNWSSSDEDEDEGDDWGDRLRSKVSRAVGTLVSESASDCSLSVD